MWFLTILRHEGVLNVFLTEVLFNVFWTFLRHEIILNVLDCFET